MLFAQPQEVNPKFRLAKTLERNHEYERALSLYLDLLRTDNMNSQFIEGVKSCYIGLQEYIKLIDFIEDIILKFPERINHRVDLGEAYYLNNKRDKALQIWNELITENKQNVTVYRQVANAMIRQRLFDQAIATYQHALDRLSNQYNLHIEIANLYKAQLDYGKATHHYLTYFQAKPKQKQFIQREILRLTDQAERIPDVIKSINLYIEQNGKDKEIYEILAGLYIKVQEYRKAFNIFQELESKKADGFYLQQFASEAYQNNAIDIAIEAYTLIMNRFPQTPLAIDARFQIANCKSVIALQSRALGDDATAVNTMESAKEILEEIINTSQSTIFTLAGYEKLGDIAYEFEFDLDRSKYYYSAYLAQEKRQSSRNKILLKLAYIYVMKNNLLAADSIYNNISDKSYHTEAQFMRNELLFYKGQFSKALNALQNQLNRIGTKHKFANNILSRIKLIQSNLQDSSALAAYANAELLDLQKKRSEAVEILLKLFSEQIKLSPLAGLFAVEILIEIDKISDARDLLHQHKAFYPEYAFHDKVLFQLALCEERLGNNRIALKNYRTLLTQFPNSLFDAKARERARLLAKSLESNQL